MKYLVFFLSVTAVILLGFAYSRRAPGQQLVAAWNIECAAPSVGERTACFKKSLSQALGKFGMNAVFDGIARLYDTDPSFQALCHDFTHLIGQQSYREFQRNPSFRLSPQTAYCAFGFYHGFMETLLSSGGDEATARQLCEEVKQQLGDETPNAVAACYHGVGHGSVDIHNPVYAGEEYPLIHPALEVCRRFSTDDTQLKFCATGVFDSLALAYYNQENGFVMRKGDPLWICREQEGILKEACYLDMMPAMLWMGNYDLALAAPLVAQHSEEAFRALTVKTIAEGSIRYILGKKPATDYLAVCRDLGGELHTSCVAGLGAGIMQFGKPEIEYKEALAFCGSAALTADEADACYASVLSYVHGRYSAAKAQKICRESPVYTQYCDEL